MIPGITYILASFAPILVLDHDSHIWAVVFSPTSKGSNLFDLRNIKVNFKVLLPIIFSSSSISFITAFRWLLESPFSLLWNEVSAFTGTVCKVRAESGFVPEAPSQVLAWTLTAVPFGYFSLLLRAELYILKDSYQINEVLLISFGNFSLSHMYVHEGMKAHVNVCKREAQISWK